jgi:hypothetical protein
MSKQVLRILELILQLKREKGYEIFFKYSPHTNSLNVYYMKGFKWTSTMDDNMYDALVYLDQPRAEGGLNSIIKHLESL